MRVSLSLFALLVFGFAIQAQVVTVTESKGIEFHKIEKGKILMDEAVNTPITMNGVTTYVTTVVMKPFDLKNFDVSGVDGKAIDAKDLEKKLEGVETVVFLKSELPTEHRKLFKDNTLFVENRKPMK